MMVAGKTRDKVEAENKPPNPFEGGDVGPESFLFHVAGRSVPSLLGGEGLSDEFEPLLPSLPGISGRSLFLDVGDPGVVGLQPGWGTPITHIVSGHLSG